MAKGKARAIDMRVLFPYPYRAGQRDMESLVGESTRNGRTLILESGTGTGKTAVSLSGAISSIIGSQRKVIFLTRTKSQQRQVCIEAGAIGSSADVISISVQGRGPSTCPIMATDHDLADGTSEEMSKLCSELKKGTGSAGKCQYYEKLGSSEVEMCISFIRSSHPDPEQFTEFCAGQGICPYEAAKRVLPYANVVSAPYAFMFIPAIRNHFLQWMGITLKDAVIIVDEAHNLPGYLRDIDTCVCTDHGLDLAASEAVKNGDPEIGEGVSAGDLVLLMKELLAEAQDRYLKRENDMIPPGFLSEEMMSRLGMTTVGIRDAIERLAEAGIAIEEKRKAKRKLPRSHLSSLASFMMAWFSCDAHSYVFLVSGGDNPSFEAYCLDPRDAAEPLRLCRSSVCMSGTLAPLDNFSADLGLRDPICRTFPSPFRPENKRTVYVPDVSTQYSEINNGTGIYEKLKKYVLDILNACPRSSAVFFPSYSLMNRFLDDGVPAQLGRDIYYERSGMSQSELMDQVTRYRTKAGSVLFAVTGGRVSEGLDFPGGEMELAVIVGIPYVKPSAKQDALIRYFQSRFGKGWEMAVKTPAVRKIRQASGRLIRSDRDRGITVILDRRIVSLDIDAELTDDPVGEVRRFFA